VGTAEGGFPSTPNGAFDGCEGEALLVNLDLEGVSVSTGSACAVGGTEASPVLLAMGCSARRAASTLRFSVRDGVGEDDVERVRVVDGRRGAAPFDGAVTLGRAAATRGRCARDREHRVP
jgi:cysteine sulfinate desulfinase/cysteine desulfurase-like protein